MMKLLSVFKVWLLANLFIALCGIPFCIVKSQDYNAYFSVLVIGLAFTIPSLIVLLGFNLICKYKKNTTNKSSYFALIFIINIIYALCTLFFHMAGEFYFLYLITTLCGWGALYFINK